MNATRPEGWSSWTTVRCRRCGVSNLGIDIWCARCGSNLEWDGELLPARIRARSRWRHALRFVGSRIAALGGIYRPTVHLRRPALHFSSTARAVAVILGVFLTAALAVAASPSGRTGTIVPSTALLRKTSITAGSPLAVALPAVEASSGLVYFSNGCAKGKRCLRLTHELQGVNATVVQFAAGPSTSCAAYLVRQTGAWQPVGARCGPSASLAPMPGHTDTVHVGSSCVNVHIAPSLTATIVSCLSDGTPVEVDAGPMAVGGQLWWHLRGLGWMVHEFLQP